MPNGRSGGFVIRRAELEQLVSSVPPDTIIGKSLAAPGGVTAEAARHTVKSHADAWVGVEEQDYSYYLIHVCGGETWIIVTKESPLHAQLFEWHKRWREDDGLRHELEQYRAARTRKRRLD